jgi:2-polyprenyl-6-methoxyphenol hydroxylase-like FAD-dependent oxidoreductase
MAADTNDVDVLIVGAGPVGLFLANECARRQLRFRIIETHPGQSTHSKALAIFPRTLEIFDMAGIVEPFVAAANRVTSIAMISQGRTIAEIAYEPPGTPYNFLAMVPQDVTERLFLEQLRRRGLSVEYETTFVSATQQADHVVALVDAQGKQSEIRARYVVGCDGSHSAVRHCLNLSFEGAQYSDTFMLADILTNEALPGDQLQLCPNEAGPLAIFPLKPTRRRIVATIEAPQGDAPTLDLVRELLAERAPSGFEVQSLMWSSYFQIHHRRATDLRVGRMFIAGDAAHIHSPIGGQGMNTGLQDAWNLVWKLEQAVRGRATEALLASYAQERLPVIKGVIEITDLMTKALTSKNQITSDIRDLVVPIVAHVPTLREAFTERLSGLGIKYQGSPVIVGSGRRYFDTWLRSGNILSKFVVVGSEADTPALREFATNSADVVDFQLTSEPGVALVRPDGYVAYEAARVGPHEIQTSGEVLDRQIHQQKTQVRSETKV